MIYATFIHDPPSIFSSRRDNVHHGSQNTSQTRINAVSGTVDSQRANRLPSPAPVRRNQNLGQTRDGAAPSISSAQPSATTVITESTNDSPLIHQSPADTPQIAREEETAIMPQEPNPVLTPRVRSLRSLSFI